MPEEIREHATVNDERRYLLLLDSVPHLVWALREDGTLAYWNRRLQEYMGLTAEEIGGLSWAATHPEDLERVQNAFREAFRQMRFLQVEQRLRGRDGAYRCFLSRGFPIQTPGGLECVGTYTQSDEAREPLEDLRSAQSRIARMSRVAMLGELTASLAHELHQPLAAIALNCDALLRWQDRKPANRKEITRTVNRIRRDAIRASAIVEHTRAFLGNALPQSIPLRLAEIVREVIELLDFELHRHQIELSLEFPVEAPLVMGTPVELQQVFVNLITNSIESMERLGPDQPRRLLIRCVSQRLEASDLVLVVVQDCGPGFAAADLQRIFEPFFTTKAQGLGMGLAISRSIVRRHGGELSVRNTPEGPCFEFYLPACAKTSIHEH